MSDGFTVAAPAKVNLYLHVTGRRPDGFHTLDSLVVFTELADSITVRPAEELSLTVDGPFAAALGPAHDNLVWRAAEALATAAGVPAGAEIRLTKRLPVAAGIGGGSADAAAALWVLHELWRCEGADLAALGAGLGADVPVCLSRMAAFIGGIGEEITPAPALPMAGLVLVNPGLPLATPDVFAARCGEFSLPERFAEAPATVADLATLLAFRHNDLAEAAARLCPPVVEVLGVLSTAPGCRLARMSGSGATCFGLFDDLDAARRGAEAVAGPGWWVAPTRLAINGENAEFRGHPESGI